jgi:UDP-N-acetylglucosamine--N-acetylmuramyl-(pentapeptide) pyrophosphoryl-undecaprenol N-acetylglucosamine transferase
MKILAVGGGSGGHVTPVVAVLREIKKIQPTANVRFWCDKKFSKQASEIVSNFNRSIITQTIFAGKFRRYYHMSIIRQLLMPSIVLPNIYDSFIVCLGFLQSLIKLIIWRPDVIFTKGGYEC